MAAGSKRVCGNAQPIDLAVEHRQRAEEEADHQHVAEHQANQVCSQAMDRRKDWNIVVVLSIRPRAAAAATPHTVISDAAAGQHGPHAPQAVRGEGPAEAGEETPGRRSR
jgi:hypothetical protein